MLHRHSSANTSALDTYTSLEEYLESLATLKEMDAALMEKDATLKEMDVALKEKDATLEKNKAIMDLLRLVRIANWLEERESMKYTSCKTAARLKPN